jgi:type I restriction enzyme S subunit
MTGFDEVKLSDVLTFQRGFDITKSEQSEGTVPIVSSSGISSYHNKWKVKGPGVVIGRKGTLGTVHFLKDDFWPHDTTLWIKDFKGNDPRFLSYFLPALKLESFDVGAANPTLNRNHVHGISVFFPRDLKAQRRIAAILSAYDELIENNQRRIALLEKLAEEIYREWFVRLRFPGHERTRFIKGVPVNWEPVLVGDLLKRVSAGKKYEQKTAFESGRVPILDQGQSGVIGYHDDEPGVVASLDEPIVVFANHTCDQRLIFFPFSAIQNVLPFLPSDTLKPNIYWLHMATNGIVELSDYKGHWPAFVTQRIYFPGSELTEIFGKVAAPLFKQKFQFQKAIEVLSQTRDLLLPRLISGKLSVEDLDIHFPPGHGGAIERSASRWLFSNKN